MQYSFTIRKPNGQVEVIDATTQISNLTQELVTHFKQLHAKMGNELLAINARTGTPISGYSYSPTNHMEGV